MPQCALDESLIQALNSHDALQLKKLLEKETCLDLPNYHLNQQQATLLANVLLSNQTITSISLDLGDEGLEIFAHTLKKNEHITHINFSNNGITDRGVGILIMVLKWSSHIISVDLSNNPISTATKNALNEMSQNWRPVAINLSGTEEALENFKRTNCEKNQKLEKFKVVIFIGDRMKHADKDIDSIPESRLSNVTIIHKSMDHVADSDFFTLEGRTDEHTVFLILAHGINIQNAHLIDGLSTDKFLNQLKAELNHPINAFLFSCQGAGVLKMGKIEDGISLVVGSSSKHPSIVTQSVDAILKILQWQSLTKNSLSSQEICRRLLREDIETFYSHSGQQGEKTLKFPRIGKFSLEEVKKLLQSSQFGSEDQNKILGALSNDFSHKNKISFSLSAIKNKMIAVGLGGELSTNFIQKLEIELKEKIAPANVKTFMENRDVGELGKVVPMTQSISTVLFQLFLMACVRGDVDLACAIISQYPDFINQADRTGTTPLLVAAEAGQLEITRLLLDKNPIITAKDRLERTAYDYADSYGHREICKLITFHSINTEEHVDLLNTFIDKETALVIAKALEKNTITSLKVQEPIDPEGMKSICAALKYNTSLVKLNMGASTSEYLQQIVERNKKGGAALSCLLFDALHDGKFELINELLAKGAKVDVKDSYGNTPLFYAIKYHQVNLVKIFLDKGADVNSLNSEGDTALLCAVKHGYNEIVECLLDKGANVNIKDSKLKTAMNMNYITDPYTVMQLELASYIQEKVSVLKNNHFKKSLKLFGKHIGYGCSLSEKITAAQALNNVLKRTNSIESLKNYSGALKHGRLRTIYQQCSKLEEVVTGSQLVDELRKSIKL